MLADDWIVPNERLAVSKEALKLFRLPNMPIKFVYTGKQCPRDTTLSNPFLRDSPKLEPHQVFTDKGHRLKMGSRIAHLLELQRVISQWIRSFAGQIGGLLSIGSW